MRFKTFFAASASVLLAPVALGQTVPVVDFDGNVAGIPGVGLFGSLPADLTETAETIQIDTSDFGGLGLPIGPVDFDSDGLQIRIRGRLLPGNVADSFAIAITDDDGDDSAEGLGSDNYQWRIPTGLFSESDFTDVVYSLGSTPLATVQSAGTDFGGDGVANFGAEFFLIQSEFDIRDRLAIEIDEIVIEPVCLTASYYIADYGTGFSGGGFSEFGNPGVLTETANSLEIRADDFGGAGRTLAGNTIFDDDLYQLRVTARLLPGNNAANFRVVIADSDGDDSAAGLGAENWEYQVNTDLLNETTFTDVTIPIASGDNRQPNFNSTFDGDGVINFADGGVTEWFVQSQFGSTDALRVEIREIVIEPITTTPGVLLADFGLDSTESFFSYGTFSGPFAFMDTPEGRIIDATGFGGLGENDGQTREIEAASTLLQITGRTLDGNEVGAFDVILLDTDGDDDAEGTGTEEFFFQFQTADFIGATEDEFVTVSMPLTDPGPSFRQQGFNSLFDGDGIQNYGLVQWQFSSGSDADPMQFLFEIDTVRLVPRLPLFIDPDLDGNGDRDFFDLLTFLAEPQDLTNDGVIDSADIERYLLLAKCACPS